MKIAMKETYTTVLCAQFEFKVKWFISQDTPLIYFFSPPNFLPSQTQLATINTNMDEANSRNFPPPPPTEEELEMRQRQEFVETHQFPREDLLLQEKLGEGEYGPIYRLVYNIP